MVGEGQTEPTGKASPSQRHRERKGAALRLGKMTEEDQVMGRCILVRSACLNFSTSCMGKVIPSQLSYYEDQISQGLFDKQEKNTTNHHFFHGRKKRKSYLAAQNSRGSDFLGGDSRSSGAHLRSRGNISKALLVSGNVKSE